MDDIEMFSIDEYSDYNDIIEEFLNLNTEKDFQKLSAKVRSSIIFKEFEERNLHIDEYNRMVKRNFEESTSLERIHKILKLNFIQIFYELFNGNTKFEMAKFILKTKQINPLEVPASYIPHSILLKTIHRFTILCLCEQFFFKDLNKNAMSLYSSSTGYPMFASDFFYSFLNRSGELNGYNFLPKNSYFYNKLQGMADRVDEHKFAYELISFESSHIFQSLKFAFDPVKSLSNKDLEKDKYTKGEIESIFFEKNILEHIDKETKIGGLFFLLFVPSEKDSTTKRISTLGEVYTYIPCGYKVIKKDTFINFKKPSSIDINSDDLNTLIGVQINIANRAMFNFFSGVLQLYSEKFQKFINVNVLINNNNFDVKIAHVGEPPYDLIISKYKELYNASEGFEEILFTTNEGLKYSVFKQDNFTGQAFTFKGLYTDCKHFIYGRDLKNWIKESIPICPECKSKVLAPKYYERVVYEHKKNEYEDITCYYV
ncbi:hypothetical protein NGRA_0851 [Nosema granulosis]|uniref:Uncharacterized protein n=1 Tax=Nosema granulosis TaxID=83296 RepID=A0A9P6L051_9MICR|nr:hypothetical protein NGRA_0851 [Nosema granulosis]